MFLLGWLPGKFQPVDMLCLFLRKGSSGRLFLRLGAASGQYRSPHPEETGPTEPILKSMINVQRTHRMPRWIYTSGLNRSFKKQWIVRVLHYFFNRDEVPCRDIGLIVG